MPHISFQQKVTGHIKKSRGGGAGWGVYAELSLKRQSTIRTRLDIAGMLEFPDQEVKIINMLKALNRKEHAKI